MSEGRTWSSEDTNRTASKSFFALRLLLDCPNYLRTALMNVADLEAECIVFATEGLLLAHDFISDCGIRAQWPSAFLGLCQVTRIHNVFRLGQRLFYSAFFDHEIEQRLYSFQIDLTVSWPDLRLCIELPMTWEYISCRAW